MKLLEKVLGVLLAGLLGLAVLGFGLNATLFRGDYLLAVADRSGLYPGLSRSLPDSLSTSAGKDADRWESAFRNTLGPERLKQYADTVVGAWLAHYQTGGAWPTLDFSELKTEVRDQGVSWPAQLSPPVATISPPPAIDRPLGAMFKLISWRWLLAAAAGAVLAVILAVLPPPHKFRVAAGGFLFAAVAILALSGILRLFPNLLSLGAKSNLAPLLAVLKTFTKALFGQSAGWFYYAAAGLGVAAVALALTPVGLKLFHHSAERERQSIPDQRFGPPPN